MSVKDVLHWPRFRCCHSLTNESDEGQWFELYDTCPIKVRIYLRCSSRFTVNRLFYFYCSFFQQRNRLVELHNASRTFPFVLTRRRCWAGNGLVGGFLDASCSSVRTPALFRSSKEGNPLHGCNCKWTHHQPWSRRFTCSVNIVLTSAGTKMRSHCLGVCRSVTGDDWHFQK